MAQMFPKGGPATGTSSAAERTIYTLFQRELDDSYIVFHSVDWQFPDREGHIRDGEADFIILHPHRGIIILEVKGGGVRYDSETQRWSSRDRNGRNHPMKRSPIKQARDAKHTLVGFLEQHPLTRKHAGHYRMHEGVWFPDIAWTQGPMLNLRPECFLDRHDVVDVMDGLGRIFAIIAPEMRQPLSQEDVQTFCDVIAPQIDIDSHLIGQMQSDQVTTAQLTLEQAQRFWLMREHSRLLIPGAAGTGKTVLAYEGAWRMAKEQRVLLLNYTRFQRDQLRDKWQTNTNPQKPAFDIHDLQSLGLALVQQAGQPEEPIKTLHFNHKSDQARLSILLMNAVRHLHETAATDWQYDAILIDEAQDIDKSVLSVIEHILREPGKSRLYVFYDQAQRVDLPGEWNYKINGAFTSFPLRNNCRNTSTIYALMQHYNPALEDMPFRGPEGGPVTFYPPMRYHKAGDSDDDVTYRALKMALENLIYDEKILPHDILIVSCRSAEKSCWKVWRDAQDFPIRGLIERHRRGSVKFVTVRSTKGLESKVVILVELDGLGSTSASRDRLLYIGVSRAQFKLVVIGTEDDMRSAAELEEAALAPVAKQAT